MLAEEQRRRIELFATTSDRSSRESTAAQWVDCPDMMAAELAGIDLAVGSAGGIRYTETVGRELESLVEDARRQDILCIAAAKELDHSQ